MSPEQTLGDRALDGRTDVYALGCVVYEMLVGNPPFAGSSAQAITAKVLSEAPPAIRSFRSTVPDQVELAVQSALARLPADRFATAGAFAAALAGTGKAASRERRADSRWMWAAGVLTFALAAVSTVAAWSWWQLHNGARNPLSRNAIALPDDQSLLPGR
jgi:serine/threonine-protein kinase